MCKKLHLLFLIFFLSFTGFASQGENLTFSDWDLNNDGLISRSEFNKVFYQHYYEDWNRTDNAYLDDEDFFTSLYAHWDADGNKLLAKEEFLQGYDIHYSEYAEGDFVAVDDDEDGFIEYGEFYELMKDADYYKDWDIDADSYLNKYELARFVFNNWDGDNSNFINQEEYVHFDLFFPDF